MMKTGVVVIAPLILLYSLLFYLCNGQICTNPVYSNSEATIRGPCPSSQVIAPVSSIVTFNCSFSYNIGTYIQYWNITDIELLINGNNPPNSSIIVTISSTGGNGYTTVTLPITKEEQLDVQCGLCKTTVNVNCFFAPQPTVISLPVQLISFGK